MTERLKQGLGREFRATSPTHPPPPDFLPHPSLARAWGECFHWPMGLKHLTNLRQTWPGHWLCQSKSNGQYHNFAAPSPARNWHVGPYPTHGELAQGLSLTMNPTRTASPLCFFLPQWPEIWLSPGSCANILALMEYYGGGGYSHTLPIGVYATQRGRDFEAPDLEWGIHFGGVVYNGV